MHTFWKKIVVVACLTTSLGLTQVHASYSLPFKDVSEFNFARTAISYLQQQKIMQGYGDGTFRPTAAISRAEFLKILLSTQKTTEEADISFSDVTPAEWFYHIVRQGVAKKVIQGFEDNTFRPHAPITRTEAMKMLGQIYQLQNCSNSQVSYTDVEENAWYQEYLSIFTTCNLDPYASVSQAYPHATLTREQAAELLFRSIIASDKKVAFSTGQYSSDPDGYISIHTTSSNGTSEYFNTLPFEEKERIRMLEERKSAVVSIIAADSAKDITDYLDTLASTKPASSPQTAYTVTHGTGFFIDRNGTVITNKHVVSNTSSSYKVILESGELLDINSISRDPVLDLAFVKVNNSKSISFPYIPLTSSPSAIIGQDAYMIGNSLGMYPGSVGQGIVTGLKRVVNALNPDNSAIRLFDMIQTDAGISQGDSGGPLLDSKGRLIGVSTALDREGVSIGFAIPIKYVLASLGSLQKYGEPMKPFLGIRYVHAIPKYTGTIAITSTPGALITSDTNEPAVVPGSPAEKAGLQPDDLIISINNEPLSKNVYLSDLLALYRTGETVELAVIRDTEKITVQVTLEARK